jgi:CDP-diacylglycerol--glycerol-3-phosphate 3-phosphatidyltransferase
MTAGAVTWDSYAAAWAGLHGGVDPREARPSVRRWLRLGYRLAYLADRLHLRPGTVTALGLLACLTVPALAMRGGAGAAGAALLVVLAVVADTADGALAVLGRRATRLGYVYDALVDRVAEACWLVALWLLGAPAAVAVAAGGLSYLHEYVRSRANAAGMTELRAVTLGERPSRAALTVLGLLLAGAVRPVDGELPAGVATIATAAWLVLAVIGLAQLLVAVHLALAGRSWPTWTPNGGTRPDTARAGSPPSGGDRPGAGRPEPAPDDPARSGVAPHDTARLHAVPPATPRPDVAGPGAGAVPVDAELLAELAKLAALPAGTRIYRSRAARRPQPGRSARPRMANGRSSPGK